MSEKQKIQMQNPIVEMDGDEMTRVLWAWIKEDLILPFVELKTEYYDLGLRYRDETEDRVTHEAGQAIKKWRVGVKCATITPNQKRLEEYGLKQIWKSPNATVRAILDGTVFRAPITIDAIKPVVRTWEKPITIARHAYGDVYKGTEFRVLEGTAELVFTDRDGMKRSEVIYEFECPGVLQATYNKDSSIESFARSCFEYALGTNQDLWFSTKDTISKKYDATFREIFERIYTEEYAEKFAAAGLEYFYTLIDDAVARVIRSKGGFIWACKNYDGDVMSDMVSTAFGSLAMMTSVLVSPEANYEYEAAHGTVTKHYYRYLKGEETSTNPTATIFAWSGALRKRGEFDGNGDLIRFADRLEATVLEVLADGICTKDLADLYDGSVVVRPVTAKQFLLEIHRRLEKDFG